MSVLTRSRTKNAPYCSAYRSITYKFDCALIGRSYWWMHRDRAFWHRVGKPRISTARYMRLNLERNAMRAFVARSRRLISGEDLP